MRMRTGFADALGDHLLELAAQMGEQIGDAVDTSVNAGDHSYQSVADAIAGLRTRVVKDPVVVALRGNSIAPGDGFEQAFLSALDEIGQTLTA